MADEKIIYQNIKEIVAPSHSVLVAWDVQNALVNSVFNKESFVASLKKLISEARENSVPIVFTKITPLPFRFESGYRLYSSMKRYGVTDPRKMRFMEPGSPEAEIYEEFKPSKDDIIIPKNTADIFVGTNFELMMRNAGIETIIFTGIATEFGVESSARSAGNHGFYPVVVEDCVSSSSKEMHEYALKVMKTQVIVSTSAEISSSWKK